MFSSQKKDIESVKEIIGSEDEIKIDNKKNTTSEPEINSDNMEDFLIKKRDPEEIEKFKEIIEEARIEQEKDSDQALFDASVRKVKNTLEELSKKTTEVILEDILKNAIFLEGNPLIEKKINQAKEDLKASIQEDSIKDISEKYPYIRPFNFFDFKNECVPLEKEHLLEHYYDFCSKLFVMPDNKKTIKKYSSDMLSKELSVYLEDLARF